MGDQPEAARGPQQAGELLLAWYAHDNASFGVRAFARDHFACMKEAGGYDSSGGLAEYLSRKREYEDCVRALGWKQE